jgi:hypothetical protein
MSAREIGRGDDPLEPPRRAQEHTGARPIESGQDQVPEDETKRKFREALAAKQGRKGEDHIDNTPQHAHGHGPAETKRTFRRRKTG